MTDDTQATDPAQQRADSTEMAREFLALRCVELVLVTDSPNNSDGQTFALAAIATAAAQAHATLALSATVELIGGKLAERLLGIAQELERLGDLYEPGAGMGELTHQLGIVAREIKDGLNDVRRALPS